MSSLLPYKNQNESISVGLDFLGTETSEVGTNSFLVDRSGLSGGFPIRIEAQLPDSIDDAFPPSERSRPPMAVIVTIKSIDGLVRTQAALMLAKKSLYAGVVTLDPSVISESASLCVYAVRTCAGRTGAPYARQKGARLAWSPEYEVRLIEKPLPKGRYLRTVWEDFDSSAIVPPGFREAFHYVHTMSAEPVLYLNTQAKPALIKLMDTKGQGHAQALPRDVLHSSIAVPVWTSLVHAALAELRREGERQGYYPVDFEDAFGGTWRGDVLKWISARVFPEMLPETALFEFCSRMGEENFYAVVVARAQLAIQSEEKLLSTYGQFAEGLFAHA